MKNQTSYGEKHIEARLSKIGAKIESANKCSRRAQELCEDSRKILMDAQTEIAELYESLGDVLKISCKEENQQK